MTEFIKFNKIPRLNKDIIITEKIDGTNGVIYIEPTTDDRSNGEILVEGLTIRAGSRNRWLTEDEDNYGFWRWVNENKQELSKLGVGRHYGEWWGQGIQRGYGLDHKRFSLFDVHKWGDFGVTLPVKCCHVVPLLAQGAWNSAAIQMTVCDLKEDGSSAAPGYMDPEGVIIYHTAAKKHFKAFCVGDIYD